MKHLLRSFRLYRYWIGGAWIKTQHRGWIPLDTYRFYRGYGFDPGVIKIEY